MIADVVPPKNVRVMTGSKEGSLHVHWDKPSCDGPYIRQYVVHLCPVREAALNNCSGMKLVLIQVLVQTLVLVLTLQYDRSKPLLNVGNIKAHKGNWLISLFRFIYFVKNYISIKIP